MPVRNGKVRRMVPKSGSNSRRVLSEQNAKERLKPSPPQCKDVRTDAESEVGDVVGVVAVLDEDAVAAAADDDVIDAINALGTQSINGGEVGR